MQCIVVPQNSYEHLNQKVAELLGYSGAGTNVKIYKGLNHALSEVCMGLTQQFPHKKKAFYINGQSPFIRRPMTQLSMQGFDVVEQSIKVVDEPTTFLEHLSRDHLFVLFAADDPMTGEQYGVDALEKAILEKKVFSVKITHSKTIFQGQEGAPERMSVNIIPLSDEYCLVVSGQRAKIPDLVAAGMYWSDEDFEKIKTLLTSETPQKKKEVLAFEEKYKGQLPLFFDHENRIFDRVVLSFNDMDGFSFIHYLAKKLGFKLGLPGFSGHLETTSSSRWKDPKLFSWLQEKGLSAQQIRGLVVISSELLTEENIPQFISVREDILKLQDF